MGERERETYESGWIINSANEKTSNRNGILSFTVQTPGLQCHTLFDKEKNHNSDSHTSFCRIVLLFQEILLLNDRTKWPNPTQYRDRPKSLNMTEWRVLFLPKLPSKTWRAYFMHLRIVIRTLLQLPQNVRSSLQGNNTWTFARNLLAHIHFVMGFCPGRLSHCVIQYYYSRPPSAPFLHWGTNKFCTMSPRYATKKLKAPRRIWMGPPRKIVLCSQC